MSLSYALCCWFFLLLRFVGDSLGRSLVGFEDDDLDVTGGGGLSADVRPPVFARSLRGDLEGGRSGFVVLWSGVDDEAFFDFPVILPNIWKWDENAAALTRARRELACALGRLVYRE